MNSSERNRSWTSLLEFKIRVLLNSIPRFSTISATSSDGRCGAGRACVWAECGLGKTFIQLEWARIVHAFTGKPVLILAPLAVSEQTAHDEAPKLGICVNICKSHDDVRNGINITNYERIGAFKFSEFGGVVADESSIIKNSSGKIRNAILGAVSRIPFRLACTATPAPNDFMELGNHAEFVGAMGYAEMLAMFFVHDGGDTAKWRLKGHARKAFFEWVATWAVMIRKPSDLGYSDEGFNLPELRIHEVVVKTDAPDDYLFPMVASTLHERLRARRDSVHERPPRSTRSSGPSRRTINGAYGPISMPNLTGSPRCGRTCKTSRAATLSSTRSRH